MTRDEALEKLDLGCHSGDKETDHHRADLVLTKLLRSLGYEDVVDAYDRVEKWYA